MNAETIPDLYPVSAHVLANRSAKYILVEERKEGRKRRREREGRREGLNIKSTMQL